MKFWFQRSIIRPTIVKSTCAYCSVKWYETGPINAIEVVIQYARYWLYIGSSREFSTSNTIQNMFEEKEEEDIGSFKDIDKYRYYPQHHILFTSLYAKIINKATHFNK